MLCNDPLANALNTIRTHERAGKRECDIVPVSNFVKEVLLLFQKHNYIGEFEFVDEGKDGHFKVKLLGNINDTNIVKPRFSVKKADWNKWEQRFIPSKDFGMLIVSTPYGLMTNADAKKKGTGGKLVAYVY
ncbi:MAG: 30S ribosomal protein S8 [Candidatus ainarchaeum sp.]|nr:30S ribosomal protein S8 [Candidatus ainarchaeum sp.]